MADEFSELIADFGNDKKVKELAEIITGVVKILLNAVDMLEGRMNELDNRMNGLEKYVNNRMDDLRIGGSSEPRDERRRASASDRAELDYKPSGREASPYSRPTPAPAYGAPGGTATASGPGPGPGGGSPMSARMQLQGELKDLFSRMRARRG